MMEYIRTHWECPAIAQRNKITSKIYVCFDVEKDGTVTNAEILCNDSYANFKLKLESAMCDSIDAKNVKESLDALESNVLKVVRGIKKLNPAKKNGEPVKCRYSIPFTYYL
ncbi:MAG: energy transducer TonB [Bacteroidaceae bacterium]|nr:energy transducer TonB [Bacteroidaceae bacterium]